MSMELSSFKRFLMVFAMLVSVAILGGCSGDDGATGPAGPTGAQGVAGPAGPAGADGSAGPAGADGTDGTDGTDGQDVDPATVDNLQTQIDELVASVEPEACAICHSQVGEKGHQSIYDGYVDTSQLAMEILGIDSVADGSGGFNVTMTVSIMKAGLPFIDATGLPSLQQHTFYVQGYDAATRSYPGALNKSFSASTATAVAGQPGLYTVTATGVSYAPENSNAQGYAYIAQGPLDTEPAGRITLYEDMVSAGVTFGNADEYESLANVEGCEKCHGAPYRKHGYREAVVAGLPTFASCKACHYDDRNGGHNDWQQMVDDPVAWGNGDSADIPAYDYDANVMNDVHMSHAMEFPYPQSMANCTTCHEGNMAEVTADDFFVVETCKSCHPVQSTPAEYVQSKRAPALEDVWAEAGVAWHDIGDNCAGCHGNGVGGSFADFHNGFDPEIYDATGNRYSDLYTAEITSLSMADGMVDIKFTGNTALMTEPEALVSFYGYDTKQFLVASHTRDANSKRMEKTIGEDNPLFTEEADSAQGSWHIVLDTTAYASDPTIAEQISSGVLKRLEVSIRPTVDVDGETVATNAVSKTLELANNTIDDDYFKGANAVARVEGCNLCHDALATTFHSGDRGGDITVCKHCHVPSSGGSHLEMQSRELASYVHAIHSFQAFDPEDINFADPVEAKRYAQHIEHTFPNFSAKNCEACHMEGTFNVPDQSESLPAVLSASSMNDAGPNGEDTWMRNIGAVPSYVTGPASRACGGCHRAHVINEDEASELAAFNEHAKAGGYMVETEDGVYDATVKKIMSLFE